MIANAQSKSVPARPTTVLSLPHTCFLCHHTRLGDLLDFLEIATIDYFVNMHIDNETNIH